MNVKPTCEAIRDRLTLYLLGDLDPRTQETIARHLAECDACRDVADRLAPTLALLRGALQEEIPDTPATLSPEHRQRVAAAFRQRVAGKPRTTAKRKPLLLRFHILEMAAVLIAGLMIFSIVIGNFGSHKSARSMTVPVEMMVQPSAMADYEPIEALEEIGVSAPMEGIGLEMTQVKSGTKRGYDRSPAREDARPPNSSVKLDRLVESEPVFSGELNVPVDSLKAVAPAAFEKSAASVTPAHFDSVAMVKSPVVLRGMAGIRSSGARGEARREAFSDDRDVPVEIEDTGDITYARQREAAPPASGPVGKIEVTKEAPILGDIPVTGRLMVNDKALCAAEVDRLESVGNERKSRDYSDSVRRDAIAIDGAVAGDLFTVVAGAVVSGGTLSAEESEVGSKDVVERLKRVAQDRDEEQVKDKKKLKALIPLSELILEKSVSEVLDDEEQPDAFAPRFKAAGVNPLVAAVAQPFSTFSIDVDTASYTVSRNYMLGGHLPPPEAVRTEEFVNFFDYAYDPPAGRTFRVAAEIAPSRFGRGLHLLKLGVKGRRLGREEQRQASLTLLVDSSGSMNQPDRLGLVRTALELLLAELADTDQVAIIQFDNRARLVLAHTPVAQRETILRALEAIQCGGGTNLEAGLGQAYEQAAKAFISRGENRILLMSDGVVNLGETATDGIVKRIEANRRQGLYLSVFGFGMGIYDDAVLKELASKGNGAYAFIDSETEARRVFVDDLSATLNTIAEDVKIQIEFNPKRVNQYRQLGYEQRQLRKEQFRDDTVDAGEVGSGQSVTALYELSLADLPMAYPVQAQQMPPRAADDDWLAVARVRYRRVDNGKVEEIEQRITARDLLPAFDAASPRFRLAAGVAAFAEILRGSPYVQGVAFEDVAAVLRPVALDLHLDARIRELVQMVETSGGLAR